MTFKWLKKRNKIDARKKSKAFDANNPNLEKLKLIVCFVKKGHGVATNELILENGASMSVMLYAEGTKEKYVADIFGGEEKSQEGIIALVSEKKYPQLREVLDNRFSISFASRGILLAFDIKSMAGVLAYKFLTDYEGATKYAKK